MVDATMYRKPEPANVQGICQSCKVNKQASKGKGKYRTVCKSCHSKRHNMKPAWSSKKKYRRFKGKVCEKCGFVPKHECQLDVDHIDGNNFNNDLSNLQTLCANCHRLKTYNNKDWKKIV